MEKTELSIVIPLGEKRKLHAVESIIKQKNKIEVITEVGPNPSANRNRGVKKASSKFIALIDAHTILPENWSEEVLDFFNKNKNVDIVGGPQLNYPGDNYFAEVSGYALSSLFGAADASQRYKKKKISFNADEKMLTSANLICKKEVFDKVKFDEKLWPGEDPKFLSDSKKKGMKIVYSPDIYVYHKRRENFRDLAQQIFKYGLTRPKKENIGETMLKGSFIVPSLFLIYLCLFPILSIFSFLFLIPAPLYLMLNLFFSIYESTKNKDARAFFVLPIIFFCIHVSYGAGFIYGTLLKLK